MSISAENTTHESVAASHALPEPTPEEAAQLEQLYKDFAAGEPDPVVDGDRGSDADGPHPEGRPACVALE